MKLAAVKQWIDAELGQVVSEQQDVLAQRNLIIQHILGISPAQLYGHPEQEIDPGMVETLKQILEQRVHQRVPLQYLLKRAWFYGMEFQVVPQAVLIPRPETEILVDRALELCRTGSVHHVVDLGTGSGCIAVTLKKMCPDLEVTAVDISEKALQVARENARFHQADICFLQGSWFERLGNQRFDLIVSNPPYIARGDQGTLQPELAYEPEEALFTVDSPEALYDSLLHQAVEHLHPKGVVLFEMGLGQAQAIEKIAQQIGFGVRLLKDLAGIDRVLEAML